MKNKHQTFTEVLVQQKSKYYARPLVVCADPSISSSVQPILHVSRCDRTVTNMRNIPQIK